MDFVVKLWTINAVLSGVFHGLRAPVYKVILGFGFLAAVSSDRNIRVWKIPLMPRSAHGHWDGDAPLRREEPDTNQVQSSEVILNDCKLLFLGALSFGFGNRLCLGIDSSCEARTDLIDIVANGLFSRDLSFRFSMDIFLRSCYFENVPRHLEKITPEILVRYIGALNDNERRYEALHFVSLPTPIHYQIENFIQTCARTLEIPSDMLHIGGLLFGVHSVLASLPSLSCISFRWLPFSWTPIGEGSVICFGAIPFCTRDEELVRCIARNPSSTIVVIDAHSARQVGPAIFHGSDCDVCFSPFQRFYVGNPELAFSILREKLGITSFDGCVWMLHQMCLDTFLKTVSC
jgi:uncharacterized membrane protein YedE/YeeE